jgi:membrane fusion protein (multidrug efflux system)
MSEMGIQVEPEVKNTVSSRRWPTVLALILAIILIAAGVHTYLGYAAVRESTDDAQIDGHVHSISARVGGTVIAVNFDNNQYVEAGAVLAVVDPKDYQVALDRARADLAEAQATLLVNRTTVPITSTTTTSQLSSAEAAVNDVTAGVAVGQKQVDAARARLNSAQARIRESQANYQRAAKDMDRLKPLIAKEEISQQQYDSAVAAADALRAQVDSVRAQADEAEQGVQVAERQLEQQKARLAMARTSVDAARTAPEQVAVTKARAESSAAKADQMRAAVAQSELNIQYTTIRAPISGIVSQRNVETGQVVQPGQPLLAVVPLEDVWVTANFKESQLAAMRPGQPVTIKVDAYDGRTYRGHVDSISAATGARFSLLPPENATGNFVKVVQRVPVKIVFEKDQDPNHLLRPGMSVVPTVSTK